MQLDAHEALTASSMNAPPPRALKSKPRTDAWVWLWTLVLTASLAWTIYLLVFAVRSDPCEDGAQCVLAFAVFGGWLMPQLLAAIPSAIGLVTLVRYAVRGNRGLPSVGLAVFVANVVTSATLLYYLSTLPSYFR
jgi:hypothetical protein